MSPTIREGPPGERAIVEAGRLPARYGYQMQSVFLAHVRPFLAPGISILDVGAGRAPTLATEDRPSGCFYAGLDASRAELEAAVPGAYDATFVHDITHPLELGRAFDVVLSWQVLEHVRSLDATIENLRRVLRTGGTLIAHFSGTFAVFSLAARLMPHRLRVLAMTRLLGHREEEKFPAYYDRCYHGALLEILDPWSSVTVVPFYRGATYFEFCRPLQRAYVAYESLAERRGPLNLATHYLLVARR